MLNKLLSGLLVLIAFGSSHFVKAQLIENKLNVYAGYAIGTFHGTAIVQEGDFQFPAFYSNLTSLNGFAFKALYKVHPYFSLGLSLHQMTGSKWQLSDQEDYHSSEVRLTSTAPTIQFHNKFREEGILNRLRVFIEVAPNLGISSFTIPVDLFLIQGSQSSVKGPRASKQNYYGISGNLGFEFDINQTAGFYSHYSFRFNWIDSMLYVDDHFSSSNLVVGLYVKPLLNKRYYY